jgi:Transmembrane exosortase (Exosortase_EpsH)
MATEAARAASSRISIKKELRDRDLLVAFFASLFLQVYLSRAFKGLFPLGAAELLGFAAIASMLQRLGSDRILRPSDYVAIAFGGVALVHPWSRVGALVLTALGLLFIFRSERRLASLGQLCLGLAWLDLWGPLVFRVIEPWFLPMETALGYLPLSLFGSFSLDGNAIVSDTGHGVVVGSPCSVFANTIRTSFIWLAMVKVQGTETRSWHFRLLAWCLVTVIFLNTLRLGLMAYSYNGYFFWHESYGASIMSWTMLATVIGFFFFGLRREGSS